MTTHCSWPPIRSWWPRRSWRSTMWPDLMDADFWYNFRFSMVVDGSMERWYSLLCMERGTDVAEPRVVDRLCLWKRRLVRVAALEITKSPAFEQPILARRRRERWRAALESGSVTPMASGCRGKRTAQSGRALPSAGNASCRRVEASACWVSLVLVHSHWRNRLDCTDHTEVGESKLVQQQGFLYSSQGWACLRYRRGAVGRRMHTYRFFVLAIDNLSHAALLQSYTPAGGDK